jgi:hypothetical protein
VSLEPEPPMPTQNDESPWPLEHFAVGTTQLPDTFLNLVAEDDPPTT